MRYQSPLQTAVDLVLQAKGNIWLTRASFIENRDLFVEVLYKGREREEINIVSNDLHLFLFDDEKVVNSLGFLLSLGARVQIICNRKSGPKEAVASLGETNPMLYRLWGRSQQNLVIYWAPIRFKQEFLVIGGVGVLFEKPDADEREWWAFFQSGKKLAEKWTLRFGQYLQSANLEKLSP